MTTARSDEELVRTLQERLRSLRTARHMSIRDLATKTGLSVSQLYRLEKGERPRVAAITLARIARALDTSVDYLLGLRDEA